MAATKNDGKPCEDNFDDEPLDAEETAADFAAEETNKKEDAV